MAGDFWNGPSTLASGDQQMELGISTVHPKYPEFAVEAKRKETFLTWPAASQKLDSEMIAHQLFYSGMKI